MAFLPATTIQDYEKKNHEDHVATIQALEDDSKFMPVYYMWLNATCHSYLFDTFELNTMMLPTVVFYLPEKNKHGHLIGKFDKATIADH
jgi:hypothetical protein